ncbi:beta-1,6-N-acetylglucosaminyltransferase [Phormidesmis sp. 146-33]
MTLTIGFILLTHNKPHQIVRLVNTLNRMFDQPTIVCHHDFSKSDLPTDQLTGNVSLVNPHLQTGWGKFSVLEAALQALSSMYEASTPPDWFVLLSGADYPIKPAKQILSDLASSSYDVYIRHTEIKYNDYDTPWQKLCYERYCSIQFRTLSLNRELHLTKRKIALKHPFITDPFLPFSKNFRCFAGEHWFCANRKAAEYLIEFHRAKPALASHYRRLDSYTIAPEESYYHSIFCNAPHLNVSQNHWRYIDWSTKACHPKTLLFEDLPKIQASSAHFARKFDVDTDAKILNELDAVVG